MSAFIKTTLFAVLASAAALNSTAAGTQLQTTFPSPAGTKNLGAVWTVAAGQSFDGQMFLFDRSPSTCNGQSEGGNDDAVFILEEGAALSNVIIGPNNGEGVRCVGACTLNNVWFNDVCEDAITFKQESGTSYVNGGGAQGAEDKVMQHNGGGEVVVKNFYAKYVGKVYRSCGNCQSQVPRSSSFTNIRVENAEFVAGVNSNYGDKTSISNSCIIGIQHICEIFDATTGGGRPTLIGSTPDGSTCATNAVTLDSC